MVLLMRFFGSGNYESIPISWATSHYGMACEQVYSLHWSKRVLRKIFASHEELYTFDMRVSRLLAYVTMLASYAALDLYVIIRIPTRGRFPVHANLLTSCFTQ